MSYSQEKRRFFKGFWGKFLKTLPLLIKILLSEKSIFCIHMEWMSSDQSEGTTWSGKYYRTNQEGDGSVYSLVRDSAVHSPPTTPPSNQHRGKNSPVPPPPEHEMASHMKLLTFKGIGDKDMDRFWFIAVGMDRAKCGQRCCEKGATVPCLWRKSSGLVYGICSLACECDHSRG